MRQIILLLYLASKIQILCDCALASIITETMFSSSLLLFPTTLIKGWLQRVIVAMLKISKCFIINNKNKIKGTAISRLASCLIP